MITGASAPAAGSPAAGSPAAGSPAAGWVGGGEPLELLRQIDLGPGRNAPWASLGMVGTVDGQQVKVDTDGDAVADFLLPARRSGFHAGVVPAASGTGTQQQIYEQPRCLPVCHCTPFEPPAMAPKPGRWYDVVLMQLFPSPSDGSASFPSSTTQEPRMSFVALDREAEERMRTHPELRQSRPVLSTARTLSDQELQEKLLPVFGELDRETFRELCASYVSAEEMVEGNRDGTPGRGDADWPWLAATVLWERWAPDIPSFEIVDNAIQAGYHDPDAVKQCEIWLDVWPKILVLADRRRITRLNELDELFGGTQCLFNWVQDMETELGNGHVVIKRFLSERRGFCEEYLARFGGQEPEIDQNMRGAIAEVYNQSGDVETVDRLYREWLTADPCWGWGWIGWADGYWLFTPRERDFPRGEEILREGLAVEELRDRDEVLLRLADLYAESGRPEEEREVREQAEALRRVTRREETRYAWEVPPPQKPQVGKEKIGRNAPCPCGSGKKYKKCCGRR